MSIKSLSKIGDAINLSLQTGSIDLAVAAFKLLNKEEQEVLLNSNLLDAATKRLIVSNAQLAATTEGAAASTDQLTKEEAENIIATNSLSTSENIATASTFSLSAALKGLGIQLKTLALQ